MITQNEKPNNYIPFDTLKVCSNTISGGGNLVAVGNVLPLLIGKGETPKIWLQALKDAKTKEFITIVEESISQHPVVRVYEDKGALNVMIAGEVVLSVTMKDQDSAVIDKLDFRPLGLSMHGDSSTLFVGGGTFANNTMVGGGTLIGLGI